MCTGLRLEQTHLLELWRLRGPGVLPQQGNSLTFRTCARAERRHAVPPVLGVVATLPPAVQQFGCDHRRHRDLRNLQRLRTAPVRKHHRKCEPSARGAESTIPSQLPQYAAVRARFCVHALSRLVPARSSPQRPRARQEPEPRNAGRLLNASGAVSPGRARPKTASPPSAESQSVRSPREHSVRVFHLAWPGKMHCRRFLRCVSLLLPARTRSGQAIKYLPWSVPRHIDLAG